MNKKLVDSLKKYFEINKIDVKVGIKYSNFCTSKPENIDIKFIAVLNFIKNQSRGNHYHKTKIEYMNILKGKLKCELFFPEDTENRYAIILEEGEQIIIKPGCAHAFTALDDDALAMEFAQITLDEIINDTTMTV